VETPILSDPGSELPVPSSGWIGIFSRRTSSGSFIPAIDGLRFISIALVILYHTEYFRMPGAPRMLRLVGSHANIGVQVFFAVSGFVLGLPFARAHLGLGARVSLKRYFLRRLTRLEPPYVINLSIWFAIQVVFLGRMFHELFPRLVASLMYAHNAIYHGPSEVNPSAWSLEVEVQFYILAPLLALVFRLSRPVRLALLSVAIGAASLVHFGSGLAFPSQAEWFLAGLLVADVYLVDWHGRPTGAWSFDALSLLAWAGLFASLALHTRYPQMAPTCSAIEPWAVVGAFVGALRGRLTRRVLGLAPIYLVGGMCYSIYLYHGYVIVPIMRFHDRYLMSGLGPFDALAGLAFAYALTVTICAIAFVLFEKPFMNPAWPGAVRRWFGRRSRIASQAGAVSLSDGARLR